MSVDKNIELTPKEIVAELDKYVVGQGDAKKAVAIALRNRWRRKQIVGDMREEIVPHNILMVGPTGVGKTEIARRLSKLVKAPFIKVEATKFTEVGYVGRDVESIIRDLMDVAVHMAKEQMRTQFEDKAKREAMVRIVEALVGHEASEETKHKFAQKVIDGDFDDKEIELKVLDNPVPQGAPMFDIPGMSAQMGVFNLGDMLSKTLGGEKHKIVKMTVLEALEIAKKEELDKSLDEDKVTKFAIKSIENDGIVFIDEIDKICSRNESGGRAEVSREGVQRDLLPLLEGSVVTTKYGPVKTDHILFIASGAFHLSKPSDLLPELQGRLPIRVELQPLTEGDLIKIMTEPKHSLLKQYKALFAVENVEVEFMDTGIKELAKISAEINQEVENIGARRLHTILEKLMESLNFTASDIPSAQIKIDKKYVQNNLADIITSRDLSKFIL